MKMKMDMKKGENEMKTTVQIPTSKEVQVRQYRFFLNTHGTHNKEYKLTFGQVGADYIVIGEWGRVGQAHDLQVKYRGPNVDEALKTYKKVLHTRTLHGYSIVLEEKKVKTLEELLVLIESRLYSYKADVEEALNDEDFRQAIKDLESYVTIPDSLVKPEIVDFNPDDRQKAKIYFLNLVDRVREIERSK